MPEKVTFDGPAKLIRVETGIIDLDFSVDVYSAWKRWIALSDNAKFPEAVRTVGGDPISDVKSLGATFFLLNGWRLKPYEGSHRLSINGNVFTDPAGSSIITPTTGNFNVTVEMFISNLSDSTLAQMSEIEHASFNGVVSINTLSGIAGTLYPIGTPTMPVNNIDDALLIASSKGLTDIFIREGAIAITASHDISFLTFIGRDATNSIVSMETGAVIQDCMFQNVTITGDFGGQHTRVENCIIDNVTNFCGSVMGSTLKGVVALGGINDVSFIQCYDGVNPGSVNVDMGGSGRKVEFRDYFGGLTLSNKTGTEECTINFSAGRLSIANTVTAGTIVVRGVGEISSNLGTATVNDDGLVNKAIIADKTWNVPLSNYTSSGSMGAYIAKKLLSTAKFIGLK